MLFPKQTVSLARQGLEIVSAVADNAANLIDAFALGIVASHITPKQRCGAHAIRFALEDRFRKRKR
jgi:hypothetical protein